MLPDENIHSIGMLQTQANMWRVLLDLSKLEAPPKENESAIFGMEKSMQDYSKYKFNSALVFNRESQSVILSYELEEFEL